MNNISLTLIRPFILGKIKPYQNLSLIILCVILILAMTLSWFENKILTHIVGYLVVLSIVLILTFIILSIPFIFFKRLEIVTITNGVLYIEIDKKPLEFNTRDLRFLLNIESKLVGEDDHLTPEILKDLSVWGNYIVISSEDTLKDKFIQFIPDEDLLKVLPQLKLETIKSRSILMNDTTHLFKNFIWMIWGAS